MKEYYPLPKSAGDRCLIPRSYDHNGDINDEYGGKTAESSPHMNTSIKKTEILTFATIIPPRFLSKKIDY